jgi:uncharacterized protein
VNTDGWEQTQTAWKTLFPGVSLILCFLHAILGIQKCLRRAPEQWAILRQKLWHAYHSQHPRQMAQRLRRIREWGMTHIDVTSVHLKMQGMAANASRALAVLANHQNALKDFGIKSLMLFGSVARDEARSDSDVDLLVEFDRPVGLFTFVRLKRYLEENLESSVDLGTPDSLKPYLQEPVFREVIRAF